MDTGKKLNVLEVLQTPSGGRLVVFENLQAAGLVDVVEYGPNALHEQILFESAK